jgi:hypothetical protein
METAHAQQFAVSIVNSKTARELAKVKAPKELAERAEELAYKHTAGELSPEELEEYKELVIMSELFAIIKVQSELLLENQ